MSEPQTTLAKQKKSLAIPASDLKASIAFEQLEEAMQAKHVPIALIGQSRAKEALSFGLGVHATGYNLYVMGEQATGRYTLVHSLINEQAQKQQTPNDWCYLNNFDDERQPIALQLPCNQSKSFVKDIENLLDEIMDTFPAVYENPSYQRKKAAITRKNELRYDKAIDEVEKIALSKGVALVEEAGSISFSPIVDGKAITDNDFARQSDEQRQHYYDLIDDLEACLSEALIEVPLWQRESAEQQRKLKRETAEQGIRGLLKELEHKHAGDIAILKHLRQLKPHLIDTVTELLAPTSKSERHEEKQDDYDKRMILVDTYVPNILVSHADNAGAPIVYEPNPTHQNLFGKIEYTSVQGSVYTNYSMITPGALHRANGGYLLLDADKLLEQPFVWEALKLALKFGQLKIELPQQDVGMVNSITQTPQAIPLSVKVILLGSRELYYTLQDYDDEFKELFRVLVDFDHEIPLEQQNLNDFVGRSKEHAKQIGLSAISQQAMARLVEYSLRLAEHQTKMSARFADVIELINESNYFCMQDQLHVLEVQHIEAALEAKKRRTGRVSEALLEDIREGHVLIGTEDRTVGQVNGLTVLEVGDTAFGTPARITATVYAGSNGVVDIEREVELGQPIHSKGVMLLTGYLGHKYAQYFPLTLSANIALEQSYGYIDGDSASLGELVALISALTDIAVEQGVAVTGSINQYGEVQAVGGINEKIEGYFSLCSQRGLNGKQGVIIPKSNALNLMLDKEIVRAVDDGLFNVYAVSSVDETLAILMGVEAGELNSKGRYPKKSVHYAAVNRLYNIANLVNGGSEE
ncbi:AAA family ATPase [Glaciecola sp. MH2013]|uniref:Lon protease family protein n=1 Tax=Glaciecola sp. MH2013 TaxID=2785524 RepID=UPI0018A0A89C|nr:ATP-binding protein [Glaciecola sp. MH2013]MBF7072632.1 AAA family ATPase [Glaciecola sp. MH2013]